MSGFDNGAIEGLISKAKELRLSRLRVADGDRELCIDLPRAAGAAKPIVDAPVALADGARDVVSPFVGYFRPALEAGVPVSKGAIVGVVESLGLPNEVLAPVSGKVGVFTVSDGDAVEYGTVITRIET